MCFACSKVIVAPANLGIKKIDGEVVFCKGTCLGVFLF